MVSGKVYRVKIEILRTDTDDGNEYATITLGGYNYGTCNPNGGLNACTWFTCPSKDLEITGEDLPMEIRIKYSYAVSVSTSNCNGKNAVSARVTLTEKKPFR